MESNIAQLHFTKKEHEFYSLEFDRLTSDQKKPIIERELSAHTAATFFRHLKISDSDLSKIWELVSEGKPNLKYANFFAAMRLCSAKKQQKEISVENYAKEQSVLARRKRETQPPVQTKQDSDVKNEASLTRSENIESKSEENKQTDTSEKLVESNLSTTQEKPQENIEVEKAPDENEDILKKEDVVSITDIIEDVKVETKIDDRSSLQSLDGNKSVLVDDAKSLDHGENQTENLVSVQTDIVDLPINPETIEFVEPKFEDLSLYDKEVEIQAIIEERTSSKTEVAYAQEMQKTEINLEKNATDAQENQPESLDRTANVNEIPLIEDTNIIDNPLIENTIINYVPLKENTNSETKSLETVNEILKIDEERLFQLPDLIIEHEEKSLETIDEVLKTDDEKSFQHPDLIVEPIKNNIHTIKDQEILKNQEENVINTAEEIKFDSLNPPKIEKSCDFVDIKPETFENLDADFDKSERPRYPNLHDIMEKAKNSPKINTQNQDEVVVEAPVLITTG